MALSPHLTLRQSVTAIPPPRFSGHLPLTQPQFFPSSPATSSMFVPQGALLLAFLGDLMRAPGVGCNLHADDPQSPSQAQAFWAPILRYSHAQPPWVLFSQSQTHPNQPLSPTPPGGPSSKPKPRSWEYSPISPPLNPHGQLVKSASEYPPLHSPFQFPAQGGALSPCTQASCSLPPGFPACNVDWPG